MTMDTPDHTRDAIISQHQQKHVSQDHFEPNPENNLPLSSSPILTSIHVSPFNLNSGENSQSGVPPTVDIPLASLPIRDAPSSHDERVLAAECSRKEELPSSITTPHFASSPQTARNELDTCVYDQFSNPQSMQPPIFNGHQLKHMNHFPIPNGFQVNDFAAYPKNLARDVKGGEPMGSVVKASNPSSQSKAPNVQPLTEEDFMADLLPNIRVSCPDSPKHLDEIQPSPKPHIAGSSTQGSNRRHITTTNPVEGYHFAEIGDPNLLMSTSSGRPQQLPAVGGFFSVNQEQNEIQQLQLSRSQYLSRPGQIYERVSRKRKHPFAPDVLKSFAIPEMNQTSMRHSVASNVPPYSHSTSTRHPVPILPATSTEPAINGGAPASSNVESSDRDCHSCRKRFKSKKDLLRHIARMHVLKGRHPCPEADCTQSFAEAHKLKRHFRTVHLKIRPFKCPECDSAFGEKGNMAQHYRKAHGTASSEAKKVKRC